MMTLATSSLNHTNKLEAGSTASNPVLKPENVAVFSSKEKLLNPATYGILTFRQLFGLDPENKGTVNGLI